MSLPVPSEQTQLAHPKYRADIDGLRAIAVLSVVGFHAFPYWVQGGFIGVDIFFVISGFLISSIIFENLHRDSFSFIEFYSRRIKRIFPALIVVLTASFVIGYFVLFADEYKQLGKHIAGGAGFIENFLLWGESGYFDNTAETKPLLHLWTLAIEEQFYIIWPLVLWLAWKKRLNLLAIVISVAVISFALNIGKVHNDAVAAFYSPQTRFWELMAGAILAYIRLYKQSMIDAWLSSVFYGKASDPNPATLNNIQSLFGAVLIVAGILVIKKEFSFPGWWAVLPTCGAVLIISAGPHAWLNRSILSRKIFVWFGLISYPLYLWHWPLLSFARIVEGSTPSHGIRIAAVSISILLAWLTYRLVEKPIRFGCCVYWDKKTISLLLLMVVVGYVGFNTYKNDGVSSKINLEKAQDLLQIPLEIYEHSGCYVGAFYLTNCTISSNNIPTHAIYGDSHARALFPGIAELDQNNTWLLTDHNSCPPIIGIKITSSTIYGQNCQKWSEAALALLLSTPSIQTVVFVFYGNKYIKGNAYQFYLPGNDSKSEKVGLFYSGLEMAVEALEEKGKSVIIVADIPELPFSPRNCIRKTSIIGPNRSCNLQKSIALESQRDLRDILNKLVTSHPKVRLYDSYNLFCDQNNCNFENDEMMFYRDPNHLSLRGSIYFANEFLYWMKKY